MKTNITNLKARLRNLTFNLAKPILRGFIQGSAIAIGFLTTALLAVAVTGNIKTWTAGETLTSSDLNTTIGSLQAAIVGIPNWAKAANGNDAVYTAGNVGIGTATPNNALNVFGKLEVGVGSRGVELSSTSPDNFLLRTFTNTPNPNFLIGIGNGAGATATTWVFGDSAGKIGIGTISPTQVLTVNGNAGNTTGVWVNNSDERLKKNIQPLDNFLERLIKLRPVTFEWKENSKLNVKTGKHIGFIAQEVEKVFPFWVDTDKDGMKWLSPEGINAAFVKAFQEVTVKITNTDARVSQLQTNNEKLSLQLRSVTDENAELKKRLDRMESVIASIERQTNEKMAKK